MKISLKSLAALSCASLLAFSCDTVEVVPSSGSTVNAFKLSAPNGVWATSGREAVELFSFMKSILIPGTDDAISQSEAFSLNGASVNGRSVLVYIKMPQAENWQRFSTAPQVGPYTYSFLVKTPLTAPPAIILTRQATTSVDQPSIFSALRVVTIPDEVYNPLRQTVNWDDYGTVSKRYNLPE